MALELAWVTWGKKEWNKLLPHAKAARAFRDYWESRGARVELYTVRGSMLEEWHK